MQKNEMNCAAFDRAIDDFVDGALSDGQRGAFDAHAASCDVCARELELAIQVSQGLAELRSPDFPAELTERVRRAVHTSPSEAARQTEIDPRRVPRFAAMHWKVAASIAVVVAGLVIAVSQFERAPTSEPEWVYDRYSEEEVRVAEQQVRWAFAYIGKVAQSSLQRVDDRVIHGKIVPPVRAAVDGLLSPRMSGAISDQRPKGERG
jgi:anti-sigma factor RsiW